MKKYLILEQIKFSTFNDVWSVKYFNQTYDQAFEKLVCLEKLNEDRKRTSYHLQEVNFSMVEEPLVLTDEVKEEQSEMPF